MKRIIGLLTLLALFMNGFGYALALDEEGAVSAYVVELKAMGLSEGNAIKKAENEVKALIQSMESDQYDVQVAIDNIDTQVSSLAKNSTKKNAANSALDRAKDRADDFTGVDADESIKVVSSIAGSLPYVTADDNFSRAQNDAMSAIGNVRRIMIAPDRPGAVPTGDIVSDFIPQIIRQLFRFASVAVLIAFTVSGIMFITAHGNDEMLTKAKQMLYFTLIGFAFVAMAFAIVKGVTDIDFFRFI